MQASTHYLDCVDTIGGLAETPGKRPREKDDRAPRKPAPILEGLDQGPNNDSARDRNTRNRNSKNRKKSRSGLSRGHAIFALALPLAILWVLAVLAPSAHAQEGTTEDGAAAEEDGEFRGGMKVIRDGKAVEMPLTDLKVRADIAGDLVTVEVEQTYENPFDERIEAIYNFPLPEDAAVNDMVMVIGDRRIRGKIKEKEEARETYERAKEEGKTTALLEQQRPNVFTQKVANIEPGHPVRVLLTFVQQVPPENGRYTWAFPLVVGPRYVGGTPTGAKSGTGVLPDTDRVPDGSQITPPILPEGVDAPYLVDFEADLQAGMEIQDVDSSSHNLLADWHDEDHVTLTLPDDERLPDRDIIISWALAGADPVVGTLSHWDNRGGYVSLMVQPPASVEEEDVRAKEIVFVVDVSGSMGGQPIDVAKELMHHAVDNLGPNDAFRLIRFSNSATEFRSKALEPTDENVELAHRYIHDLKAGGGTEIEAGLQAALTPPVEAGRMRIVVFLTDGYIGGEDYVIQEVDKMRGNARLFSVGVGSSPNRYLLDEMAIMGRGAAHYVNIDESPDEVVKTIYQRMRAPVFTDIEVDWGDLDVTQVSPDPIPDVFAGQPIVLTGRYDTPGKGDVVVKGLQGNTETELHVSVELGDAADNPAIPHIWARRKVDDWTRAGQREQRNQDYYEEKILALALEHRLMTRFTSFVAVNEKITADVEDPLRVNQVAVMTPHGVSDKLLGIQVSPNYVQPGDPEISVWAPPGAIAATAYFPFDLDLELTWDPQTERWTNRFLVPRDFADGEYQILVAVEFDDGTVQEMEVPLEVDSQRPVFEASLEPGHAIATGDVLTIEARIMEDALSTTNVDEAIGGEVLPDRIKFVRIHLPDGRIVRMKPNDDWTVFEFHFKHLEKLGTGHFEIVVESMDVAGNSSFETLQYLVVPSGSDLLSQHSGE